MAPGSSCPGSNAVIRADEAIAGIHSIVAVGLTSDQIAVNESPSVSAFVVGAERI